MVIGGFWVENICGVYISFWCNEVKKNLCVSGVWCV